MYLCSKITLFEETKEMFIDFTFCREFFSCETNKRKFQLDNTDVTHGPTEILNSMHMVKRKNEVIVNY